MNHSIRIFFLAILLLGIPSSAHADDLTDRVDKLFARWDSTNSPGCAVGVVRDGRLVYQKSFGMADLEQGARIGPHTVFHIASISKQFTAFAILLLEKDGKLSLDDDIRKHLPEMHDFGKTITIRHLLHHTSGLRDQWELLTLAGWRMEDVITDDDVLRLAFRQRDLNFEPGTRFLYCNTGYTLAARIVERVAGQPFREFCRLRIFEPLGMNDTRFPAGHQDIVADRAHSYRSTGSRRFAKSILSYGTAGATSLLTTVADLARWDQNFDEPRAGDAKTFARFQEPGTLNDGKRIKYALGLDTGEYRGLKTVGHGGADAGFRCDMLRFPSERFSVIVLSNVGDGNPGELTRRVADIYLEDKLKPVPPKPEVVEQKEVGVDRSLLDAYVGEYRINPALTVSVAKEDGNLTALATGLPKVKLGAASEREFFVRGENARITFDKPVDGQCPSVTVYLMGQTLPAKRIVRPTLTAKQSEDIVGDYYSGELGVIYSVTLRDAKLMIRHPRAEIELRPNASDAFDAPSPLGKVRFTRNDSGRVTGFEIDAGRVQRVRFARVDLRPAP